MSIFSAAMSQPNQRVAIIRGVRTPFAKSGTLYARLTALDLGKFAVTELIERSGIDPKEVQEVVYGNVIPSVKAPNIAREIVLGTGLPRSIPGYTVGKACASANQAITSASDMIFRGYADTVVVPAAQCFRFPPQLSDAEAAAIPVNYMTAALGLYRMSALAPGETVLIHNAGGGVGIAAIQLARLRRATVIGTASAAKHDALRAFGVEHAIDYRTADVAEEVKRITRGRGVDVIMDPIGGKSFLDSYRLLAPLGRLVMFGLSAAAPGERRSLWHAFKAWRATPRFDPLSMINRNRGVFGLHIGHLWSEHAQLVPLMQMLQKELEAGRLRPVVAKTFPLDQAAEAHRYIQSRANIGKVVLTT